uniref:Uncharacterized protein n=1 Tax=Minutocellus polymorphus TaxID=265543 RepID=A0A7S0AWN8_9STRA
MTSHMPNQHLPVSTVDDDDAYDGSVDRYDMLVSAEVAAAGRMGLSQGHRCCGRNGSGCCDMRRAVVIVNVVDTAICVFYAIYFAILAVAVEEMPDESYGGEDSKSDIEGMMVKMEHVFIILSAIKIPLNGLGIYGAVKFKYRPVAAALAAYSLQFALNVYSINIGGLLLTGFFAYPHVVFLKELKSGVMSEMNYPTERFSCCCV